MTNDEPRKAGDAANSGGTFRYRDGLAILREVREAPRG